MTCTLFKITLSCLFPQGEPVEKVFWAYNFNEDKARDAALRWVGKETGWSTIDNITKVDVIK